MMNKLSLSLALLVSTFSVAASADDDSYRLVSAELSLAERFDRMEAELAAIGQLTDRVGSLEREVRYLNTGMQQMPGLGGCGCCSVVPAPGFFVSADWLLWRASRGGLDFAVQGGLGNAGQIHVVNPGYESGVRFEFGWRNREKTDVIFRYTYFDSDTSATVVDPTNQLSSTRLAPAILGIGDLALASSSYGVELNVADLESGRWFEPNDHSAIRMFGGLKLAYINQGMDTLYDFTAPPTAPGFVSERVSMDAFGMMMGAESRMRLMSSRFTLFSRVSGSVMAAWFDASHRETQGGAAAVNTVEHERRVISQLEVAAGLAVRITGNIELLTGYEFQRWYNMASFTNFVDDLAPGNLARDSAPLGFDGGFVRIVVTQ